MSRPYSLVIIASLAACGDDAGPSPELVPGQATVLNNTGPACDDSPATWYIGVDPEEVGRWVVARVAPARGAFQVEGIRYELKKHDHGCDPTLAHRVRVFTGTGTTPPTDPEILHEDTLAAAADEEPYGVREITVGLPEPIVLADGESVFVAFELTSVDGQTACVKSCMEGIAARGRDFYSEVESAPFAWTPFAEVGIDSVLDVSVDGRPLLPR